MLHHKGHRCLIVLMCCTTAICRDRANYENFVECANTRTYMSYLRNKYLVVYLPVIAIEILIVGINTYGM